VKTLSTIKAIGAFCNECTVKKSQEKARATRQKNIERALQETGIQTQRHQQLIADICCRDGCIIVNVPSHQTLNKPLITFTCKCGQEYVKKLSMMKDVGAFCRECTSTKMEEKRRTTRQMNKERAVDETAIQSHNWSFINYQLVNRIILDKTIHSFACIYGWYNTYNHTWYIGQSLNFYARTKAHVSSSHNKELHHDFTAYPDKFNLYVLSRPPVVDCINDLQLWLDQEEMKMIDKHEAYTRGYNKTKGGSASKMDVWQMKSIKQSLQMFERDKVASEWYYKNVGPLGLVRRDYVIPVDIEQIGGMRLGHIVHKWRNNRNTFYFQIKGNIESLFSYGFSWSHKEADYDRKFLNIPTCEPNWYDSFKIKWLASCEWYFCNHGHINVPQSYVVPSKNTIPVSIHGMKLGSWISKVRQKRALENDSFVKLCLKRMLLMDTREWRMFLIEKALFFYVKDFAQFNYIPQSFSFPQDYRIQYLQGYGLSNIHNLWKRRNDENTAEHVMYHIMKKKLAILYTYLYLKTEGKPYCHGDHLKSNPDVLRNMGDKIKSKIDKIACKHRMFKRYIDTAIKKLRSPCVLLYVRRSHVQLHYTSVVGNYTKRLKRVFDNKQDYIEAVDDLITLKRLGIFFKVWFYSKVYET
jgi:hypothetical protein